MTTKARSTRQFFCVVLAGLLALVFSQCAAPIYPESTGYSDETPRSSSRYGQDTVAEAPRKKTRPGLGTAWGEGRSSHVRGTDFVRGSSSPNARLAIRYNDADGAPAGKWSARQPFSAGNLASVGIKSGGRYLKSYKIAGEPLVIGKHGDRYSIYVKNHSDQRIEVVLSVDGLDVMDGKSASYSKRGYVIAPRGRLTVEGFRRSYESVAAFRFGSVDSSYAARTTGSPRNVGVIGAAIFAEKDSDWELRKNADPFPGERGSGQFAKPPR